MPTDVSGGWKGEIEMKTNLPMGLRITLIVVGVGGLLVGLFWLAIADTSSYAKVGGELQTNADGTVTLYEEHGSTEFDIRSAEGTFPVSGEADEVTVWRVNPETGEGIEEMFRGTWPEAEAYLQQEHPPAVLFTGTQAEYEEWRQSTRGEDSSQMTRAPIAVMAGSVLIAAIGIWPSRHQRGTPAPQATPTAT